MYPENEQTANNTLRFVGILHTSIRAASLLSCVLAGILSAVVLRETWLDVSTLIAVSGEYAPEPQIFPIYSDPTGPLPEWFLVALGIMGTACLLGSTRLLGMQKAVTLLVLFLGSVTLGHYSNRSDPRVATPMTASYSGGFVATRVNVQFFAFFGWPPPPYKDSYPQMREYYFTEAKALKAIVLKRMVFWLGSVLLAAIVAATTWRQQVFASPHTG
ncbi:MAG: hypothetical protein HYZ50_11345 [Deltaproteobacteria bacterium]|nr:hypothetical protein [Deltaproteobacteria bacterium]